MGKEGDRMETGTNIAGLDDRDWEATAVLGTGAGKGHLPKWVGLRLAKRIMPHYQTFPRGCQVRKPPKFRNVVCPAGV